MVAKTLRRIPCRRRPKPIPTPDKPLTASAVRRTLHSCRRKLLRLFSRLTASKPQNLGFCRLQPVAPEENAALPPPSSPSKKTLILDLDETLVHSKTDPAPDKFDFVIYPSIDGHIVPFYVLKRPGVDQFLKMAAEKFEVVVFTAGLREYATLVLDLLDPKGEVFAHRLYRDSCREIGGKFVKDLSEIGRDLASVAIVDDNPGSYALQRENALPVKPFVNDLGDRELEKVMGFMKVAAACNDMRDAVKSFLPSETKEEDAKGSLL